MKTLGLLVLLALTLVACHSEAKTEAASLAAAFERYQRADSAQKAGAAADVRAVSCASAEVVAAKVACVEAIDATVKALGLKHEVESGLDDLEQKRMSAEDPRAKALPGKLDDAERLLIEGRRGMKSCEEKLTALRMKHGV